MIIGSVDKTAETQEWFALTFIVENYIMNTVINRKKAEHFHGNRRISCASPLL